MTHVRSPACYAGRHSLLISGRLVFPDPCSMMLYDGQQLACAWLRA